MNRPSSSGADRLIAIGLISGTSMDGIDAVVVDFSTSPPRLLAACTVPFDVRISAQLEQVRQDPDGFPAHALGQLDGLLGDALATAALTVIEQAGVDRDVIRLIGSHGQTVLHRPDANPPVTLQIGDPNRIAQTTGIVTVSDFRRADLAAGGQGAPLAPLLHDRLLRSAEENRAVVNLGGIANVTLLRAGGGLSGFDTGPANCLLDEWFRSHHDGRFDDDGQWASAGQVDHVWLNTLLEDPHFARPPPKSTGIEHFSRQWLDRRLPDWSNERPADVQSTLAELTARTIADALERWAGHEINRLLLCGGGVHNRHLVSRIAHHLEGIPCESTAGFGLDPDHVEAILFAWLGLQRLRGQRLATGVITGANSEILAGTITEP